MTEYDVKRLALVFAIQAEVEGMKAENADRAGLGHSPAWSDINFCEKAEEFRELANKHDEQL